MTLILFAFLNLYHISTFIIFIYYKTLAASKTVYVLYCHPYLDKIELTDAYYKC